MAEESWPGVVPPTVTPANMDKEDQHWRHFDNSVNAVSFGFVATAILISMFLVMAIFERFLRPRPTPASAGRSHGELEAQLRGCQKLDYPSPKGLDLPCASSKPAWHGWYCKLSATIWPLATIEIGC